jgi:site-specific DNA recombinase
VPVGVGPGPEPAPYRDGVDAGYGDHDPAEPAVHRAPERPRNAYVREDRIVPHLPALHLLLTEPAGGPRRRRTRRGTDVRRQAAEDVIGYLREQQMTLTYDPATGALRAGTGETAQTVTLKAS